MKNKEERARKSMEGRQGRREKQERKWETEQGRGGAGEERGSFIERTDLALF